jgi:hypothetical protein
MRGRSPKARQSDRYLKTRRTRFPKERLAPLCLFVDRKGARLRLVPLIDAAARRAARFDRVAVWREQIAA